MLRVLNNEKWFISSHDPSLIFSLFKIIIESVGFIYIPYLAS